MTSGELPICTCGRTMSGGAGSCPLHSQQFGYVNNGHDYIVPVSASYLSTSSSKVNCTDKEALGGLCGVDGMKKAVITTMNKGMKPLNIPLEKQALWLVEHLEDVHSPRPEVVSDEELRGLLLIRVLGSGAREHGDSAFHKTSEELQQDFREEWADAEFYDLVDRFGKEISEESS